MFTLFSCDRNVITSVIYDTTDNHLCLSQNRQLFCSCFVHERVVFFVTEIGSVTEYKVCWRRNLQDQYALLLFSAQVHHAYLIDSNYVGKIALEWVAKKQWFRKYHCIYNKLRSIGYSMCDFAVLTARSLSLVKNLHSISDE
jgi:hypothetical protein